MSVVPLREDEAAVPVAAEPPALVARPGMNRPASVRRANGVRVSPLQSRHVLVRATLVSADLLALALAFAVTEALWVKLSPAAGARHEVVTESLLFFVMLPVWPAVAGLYGDRKSVV